MHAAISRRLLFGSVLLPALGACTAPLPDMAGAVSTPEGLQLLAASAEAHGLGAYTRLNDIAVSYQGHWRPLVDSLQPDLVDAGFRGGSQERILPASGLVAQAHSGPKGHKQVVRRSVVGEPGQVRVWFNGAETQETAPRAAAALVADGYSLFLLGPMLLQARTRTLVVTAGGMDQVFFGGRGRICDVLDVLMAPGLGFSAADRLKLWIDRQDRLMRRVRFSLEGLNSTQGAVAEVDTLDHVAVHGVHWPTWFQERLLRPAPLPVHDWSLTGLDVDRGLSEAEIDGPVFTGPAVLPARPVD